MNRKNRYIMKYFKRGMALLCACTMLFSLGSCKNKNGDKKVVFTAGMSKNEVFRIDECVCTVDEVMLILTNTQNQYENVYGEEIWNTSLEGTTLEQNVKETVLEKLAQIKTMYLLAKSRGITLTTQEEEKLKKAAEQYVNSLNEQEVKLLQTDVDKVNKLYREYLMAEKVYDELIGDINPEISDDEARIITVQDIFFRTYSIDSAGNKEEYSDSRRSEVYAEASEVLKKVNESPDDFAKVAAEYSDDTNLSYSFGKGDMDPDFEQAAFALETNQISQVIATENGYHIIKCISTFDREETDANKIKIVEKRRNEAFGKEYELFEETLARRLNEEVWNQISLIRDKQVVTDSFFKVYHEYFDDEL